MSDSDGPPALCAECSAKWHSYVRSRARVTSDPPPSDGSAVGAAAADRRPLFVQGEGSVLIALNAASSEPATQGAGLSSREVDLDEIEFGSRLEQLRAALARVKSEPGVEPINPSECMAAAMVWTRIESSQSPLELKHHNSSNSSAATAAARAKSPSPRSPSRGGGSSSKKLASPPRSTNRPIEAVADSMTRTVADKLQIMQWELERRDRNVRQRESTLRTEQRELQKLRTQLAVKQATLETAFLELKKREHDIQRGEVLLAEKRRALQHREDVDTMVANASARRLREIQQGPSPIRPPTGRSTPRASKTPPLAASRSPSYPSPSAPEEEMYSASPSHPSRPTASVDDALEIYAATEQLIDEQRQQLVRETEAAWRAIRIREEQIAERERQFRAMVREHYETNDSRGGDSTSRRSAQPQQDVADEPRSLRLRRTPSDPQQFDDL